MRWCCSGHNSTASSSNSSSNHSKDAMSLTTAEWLPNKKKDVANGSKNTSAATELVLRHGQTNIRLLNEQEERIVNPLSTINNPSGAQRVLKSSLKLLKGPGRKASTDSTHQKNKAKVQYADKLVLDESVEEEEDFSSQKNSQSKNEESFSHQSHFNHPQNESTMQWTPTNGKEVNIFNSSSKENFDKYGPMLLKAFKIVSFFFFN